MYPKFRSMTIKWISDVSSQLKIPNSDFRHFWNGVIFALNAELVLASAYKYKRRFFLGHVSLQYKL